MTSTARLGVAGLRPVSARLVTARMLARAVPHALLVLLGIGGIVLGVRTGWWWMHVLTLVPLAVAVQSLLLTGRRVRSIGYLDRAEDLVCASGILLRTEVVTPYGRIQSVELTEGPIERRLGLATVHFATASTTADGHLPGLERAEAERLRDLLAARGVERMQSL